MATLTKAPPRFDPGPTDDPFHDPLLLGIAGVLLLVLLVILALTGLLYWGVQHGVPPWSSNSFPAPIPH